MKTKKECEAKITELESQLTDTQAAIFKTMQRSDAIESEVSTCRTDCEAIKKQRQEGLAKGENVGSFTQKMEAAKSKSELLADEKAGLETLLQVLRGQESNLMSGLRGAKLGIPQLRSLELAAEYNELAEKLAIILMELNETNLSLESQTGGDRNLVVFLPRGDSLPRAFFDEDGLNLESFVAKNPGKYHTNHFLSPAERFHYSWQAHQAEILKKLRGE